MLLKILFTAVVVIGVVIFFRIKHAGAAVESEAADDAHSSVSPRALAFGVLGALTAISVLIFALDWRADNRIVDIRVIADGGAAAHYRARHQSIKGRNFVTLEGTRITLGDGDRMEMMAR